jgi:hypothetical protein
MKASLKRWNGRRSMFLGNWEKRRDGAFSRTEERGIPFERTKHPVIDGVFEKVKRDVDRYACVKFGRVLKEGQGVESIFRVANDLRAV